MKIQSVFTFETGFYSEIKKEYVNRKTRTEPRELEMTLEDRTSGRTLQFIGGPTGHESYYVEDLKKNITAKTGNFCICGGTINSWPRCIVKVEDVLDFIMEN